MATLKTDVITRNQPVPTAVGNQVVPQRAAYALAAALALNDTIVMCKLPADHLPVDFILDTDDLDSGATPSITLNAGVTGSLSCFLAGSTIGQAGGVVRADKTAGFRLTPSSVDREVIITVAAAPATGATTGTIGITMLTRPSYRDQ